MTAVEFFDKFDVLYENITSNASPGLNGYEKSVCLTKSEREIAKNYFNPKGNKYQEGFDGSAKRQVDFSKVIETKIITPTTAVNAFDHRAKTIILPSDLFIPVNEMLDVSVGGIRVGSRVVIPISYDEYARLMSKPYKEPLKNQAWRIITGQTGDNNLTSAELIVTSSDSQRELAYKILYVRKLKPIIVEDLTEYGTSIDGITAVTECELDESLHDEILQRAVELAKAAYSSDQSGQAQLQNQITVGQRSE